MREFVVEVNNEILGNSIRIFNLRSLKGLKPVAYELALRANEDGQKHTAGMWTVYPFERRHVDLLALADRIEAIANDTGARLPNDNMSGGR